jgi:hypothetical protein
MSEASVEMKIGTRRGSHHSRTVGRAFIYNIVRMTRSPRSSQKQNPDFEYPLYRPKGFNIVLDPGESDEATVSASSRDADPGTELEYDVSTPAGQSMVAVAVETESNTTESTN